VWLLLAGRGFGKSRTGAEWVRAEVESSRRKRIALVGRTAADVRDVMIEGESGILAISPPWFKPVYEPSKRRLTWPNGAIATTYSGDKPDQLRGPQHDGFWADELASWRYTDAWDQLQFGLRLGDDPRGVVTTTPRPTKIIRELVNSPDTHVTRGSTYDNRANMPPAFFTQIIRKFEGSRLGRQELNAEILDDNPNALWQRSKIDELRVSRAPDLFRIVVGVDPAATSGEESDATGIVVAGIAKIGNVTHGYVLDDRTIRGTPAVWARQVVAAYRTYGADRVIGETNNGGEMVGHTIHTEDPGIRYKAVHASRGKYTRAEPISLLYDQGRFHHVGSFPQLEDEMCEWVPGEASPNRMDALVWAATELMPDCPHRPVEIY
jgi:phage terminase large subunit-like protein